MRMIAITFTVTCTLAIALLWWFTSRRVIEQHFTNNTSIVFLSAKEVRDFFQKDMDGYVSNFTPVDLVARNVATQQEYKERSAALAAEPTAAQKERVRVLAQSVDQFLIQSNQLKLAAVPWKLAFVNGNGYENGYPHTRADIIFISVNDLESHDLASTLLHEKVHVYQRMYPEEMVTYLETNGYRPWRLRSDEPMARANPDLDAWIYIDPRTNKPMVALYTSDKPSSISDVILQNAAYEHPYERMAYEIAAQLPAEKDLSK